MVILGSVFHHSTRLNKHRTKSKLAIETPKSFTGFKCLSSLHSPQPQRPFFIIPSRRLFCSFVSTNPATHKPNKNCAHILSLRHLSKVPLPIQTLDTHPCFTCVFSLLPRHQYTLTPASEPHAHAQAQDRTSTDLHLDIGTPTIDHPSPPSPRHTYSVPLYPRETRHICASPSLYLARDKAARASRSPRVHNGPSYRQ